MKVLVIGSGGREHALAWRIAQSPRVDQVFVAPGNAGTAVEYENIHLQAGDISQLIHWVHRNAIDLTVVGPEAPLADGIVDAFEKNKLRVFGPSGAASQLEASKLFCKQVLSGADVPTATYHTFASASKALQHIEHRYPDEDEQLQLVVKANGLAAGKGVFVCDNRDEVLQAIEEIANERAFGTAGDLFLLEERLVGEEASLLAITDGKTILTLPPAQDHKPAYDGDLGPNTGGMGAYCPAPLVDAAMQASIEEKILVPTVHQMQRSGHPFRGVLYAGLMIGPTGPKVLEYNVRFGDPECQPLLLRLQSDLVDVIEATIDGQLDQLETLRWDPRPAVCVVMASEGYPGSYEKGHPIEGLEEASQLPDVKVFHAGTSLVNGQVVNQGGRVLGVTALGDSISDARNRAYQAVEKIHWQGSWYRSDIGNKAIAHSSS
jgi:phosphoribosylamine--glycine ligase